MKHTRSTCILTGLIAVALSCTFPLASAADALESGLAQAMHLKKGTNERVGTSGKAIQAYMLAGYIGKKPDARMDYTDYYVLKQPAPFMGHELVMIEEEYMLEHIGCCVSPGAGLSVKVNGSLKSLEAFARAHRCRLLDTSDELQAELARLGSRRKLAPGQYVTLTCRERDAQG